jgi:hypothetical protein
VKTLINQLEVPRDIDKGNLCSSGCSHRHAAYPKDAAGEGDGFDCETTTIIEVTMYNLAPRFRYHLGAESVLRRKYRIV